MSQDSLEQVVRNIDARLARVEQILPTLATKDDFKELATKTELEPLATKTELEPLATKKELEPLATKKELEVLATKTELEPLATKTELEPLATKTELEPLATKKELEPLATKKELEVLATKTELAELRAEVAEEGNRTRRHFDVVAERLEGHIRLVAEGQVALREQMDRRFDGVAHELSQLDRRVMRLEAGRRR